ncbi:MAG: DeoR/GlpR family DNA-binding transcription regulator [Clostridia bacterium]|nr:DeoR/GlpR family DNA-binding transcription regulator [Clostridia bacterium]
MIPYTRRKSILELMHLKEIVTIEEIINRTNVSDATVRRDLKTLASEGHIELLSGGAAKLIINVAQKSLSEKIDLSKEEKKKIAMYAATRVNDGQFIFMGPGTTENYMIEHLEGKNITVATNGAFHIEKLLKYNISCILIGGTVLTDIAVVVGTTTINQIKGMNFDKCFVGAAGITIQNGVSSSNCEVAQMNKAAIEQSKEAFLIADSTKFGQNSRYKYADIDDERLTIITTNNCDLSLYGDKVIAVE